MSFKMTGCVIVAALPGFFVTQVHAQPTSAGAWPSKTIRWIVPWPPGGGADVFSRILQVPMSEALGTQIVIDNRGGAAGNIGAEIAAKSPPDGYTIVFAYSGTHSINPHIYRKMPFRESDFAPIIWNASVPQVVVVHPSLPVKTPRDIVALAKSRPDQFTYGSSGAGAINHLAGALFASVTGAPLTHVPYKGGGPAAIALMSGEIAMIFGEPATIIQHLKSGKMKGIAVTSAKRALALPNLPTVQETGFAGYDVTSWNGMLAPAAVPADIIKRLNAEFNRIIATPDMRKRLLDNGFEPVGGAPERFGELIRSELAKWAPVVKAANIRVD